jgi:hypothetical protein
LKLLEIPTGAIHDLGAVQADGLNANADFTGIRLHNRQVLEFENLRSSEATKMTLFAVFTGQLL